MSPKSRDNRQRNLNNLQRHLQQDERKKKVWFRRLGGQGSQSSAQLRKRLDFFVRFSCSSSPSREFRFLPRRGRYVRLGKAAGGRRIMARSCPHFLLSLQSVCVTPNLPLVTVGTHSARRWLHFNLNLMANVSSCILSFSGLSLRRQSFSHDR